MGKINLREAFASGWRVYRERFGVLIGGTAIMLGIFVSSCVPIILAAYIYFKRQGLVSSLGHLFPLLVTLVFLFVFLSPLMAGFVFLVRDCFEGGEAKAKTVFRGYSIWGITLLSALITAGALLLGAAAFGVGAIATGAVIRFLFPLIVDGATPGGALRKCWQATKTNFGSLVLLWLATLIILDGFSGASTSFRFVLKTGYTVNTTFSFLSLVWVLFARPFVWCVTWAAYRQVFPLAATAVESPPTV
jgi:hypothetical protein